MRCPDPNCWGTVTTVSMTQDKTNFIKRKRRCTYCGKYFWTEEKFLAWTIDSATKMMEEMKGDERLSLDDLRAAAEGLADQVYVRERHPRGYVAPPPTIDDGVKVIPPSEPRIQIKITKPNGGQDHV